MNTAPHWPARVVALALAAFLAACANRGSNAPEPTPAPDTPKPPAQAPAPDSTIPGVVALFNGKDLSGWTQRGGKAAYFVEGDAIVGETRPNQPNSFLCTQREFSDFILELEFLADPEANSGIQFRSQSRPDYKNGIVHGYQAEIDTTDRAWSAGIYDEGRRGWLAPLDKNPEAQGAFKQNQWNHLKIECRGSRIRTWLNGVPCADLQDDLTPKGFIALQVHGVGDRQSPLRVRWKNFLLTDLSARR